MSDWQPTFPGQRPPFPPGNSAAVRHGANSARLVDPLAEQIRAELLGSDGCPDHLHLPLFGPAVLAWSRAEARAELLNRWLGDMDTSAPSDGAYAVLAALHRAESAAAKARAALGLDPTSAARLARDMAASRFMNDRTGGVERLAAQGAELAARDMAALDAAAQRGDDDE